MVCLAAHQGAQSLSPQAAHHPGVEPEERLEAKGSESDGPGSRLGSALGKSFSLFRPLFFICKLEDDGTSVSLTQGLAELNDMSIKCLEQFLALSNLAIFVIKKFLIKKVLYSIRLSMSLALCDRHRANGSSSHKMKT